MSRIGKQPILIPGGVTVEVSGQTVNVTGAKGTNSYTFPRCVLVAVEGGSVVVSRVGNSKDGITMFGTARSLVNNMIIGVSKGYKKELQIEGVGYKAQMKGSELVLTLGYSHDINYGIPQGIKVAVQGNTTVTVEGIDKNLVGQVAARIRGYAPAEPYKGKGVRYTGEQIRRKEGKAVA